MKVILDAHDKGYLKESLDLSDSQMDELEKYLGRIDLSVDCSVFGEAEDWREMLMEDDDDEDEDDEEDDDISF